MKRLFEIDPWQLVTHQLDVTHHRLQESLTATGNSYMGLRGNFEESYSNDTHQGVYLAGVWFPDKTRVGWWKNGYPDYFGKAINSPNFISIPLQLNGIEVDLAQLPYKEFNWQLDLHNGLVTRSYIVTLPDQTEVALNFKRFLSLDHPELAVMQVSIKPLNQAVKLQISPQIEADVHNEDANYHEQFWQILATHDLGSQGVAVQVKTKPNPFNVPQFTVYEQSQATLKVDQEVLLPETATITDTAVTQNFTTRLETGQTAVLLKKVVVITSRDVAADQQASAATTLLNQVATADFEALLLPHNQAWQRRWQQCDVTIEGDPEAQQGIRFNLSQLLMTYYGEDARLNIGPKGFTGEKYGGATYWDTEAYLVPLYLAIAPPTVTRQLLEYRYQQLPGARHNARQQGLAGALYPMVTFDGIECHNEWEITFEEIHRNAAVAFAIYQYTCYTGDESYLKQHGAVVLTEIARFWADRVHYSAWRQHYVIHGVTGPNEYENNVNNNWYTNRMAQWVLTYTAHVLTDLAPAVATQLKVTTKELDHWHDIAEHLYLPEDQQRGIFIQNDDYLDKDLRPVSELDPAILPLNQHWSWDRILRSPFIKQADVLQGLYFLTNQYTLAQKKRNFDFYEPMTVHESSLSASIHSIIAAEIGYEEKAVALYQRTARLDLDNYNDDTADGLHITSMSGSWLAIVQGFAGMRYQNGTLSFQPFCPKNWQGYTFKMQYQGRLLAVEVTPDQVTVTCLSGAPLTISVNHQSCELVDTLTQPLSTRHD